MGKLKQIDVGKIEGFCDDSYCIMCQKENLVRGDIPVELIPDICITTLTLQGAQKKSDEYDYFRLLFRKDDYFGEIRPMKFRWKRRFKSKKTRGKK